jgi:uncharacterized membrane protein
MEAMPRHDPSTSAAAKPGMPGRRGDGVPEVGRIEAFSDGVVAIIITIMVLELHPPLAGGFDRLWTLWPVFLAYLLSYAYVAIYWVNHHRLSSHARTVSHTGKPINIVCFLNLKFAPAQSDNQANFKFSTLLAG